MTLINFYCSDTEWWIEYEENGDNHKIDFQSCQEYKNFILNNDLGIVVVIC